MQTPLIKPSVVMAAALLVGGIYYIQNHTNLQNQAKEGLTYDKLFSAKVLDKDGKQKQSVAR